MEDVDRKRKLETKESKPAKKVRVESEREESETEHEQSSWSPVFPCSKNL